MAASAQFVSDLVRNPEDTVSRVEAQLSVEIPWF